MQRLPRLVEILFALVLCGVVALWATRLSGGASIAAPPIAPGPGESADARTEQILASARLFGSRRPGVLSDNVRALGVIADASGNGSVIVSVDGQAPKVYRVGDTLDGRRVSAIRANEIELEAGGARQTFRLPPPRPAADGLTIGATGVPAIDNGPQPGPGDPAFDRASRPPAMRAPLNLAPPPMMQPQQFPPPPASFPDRSQSGQPSG